MSNIVGLVLAAGSGERFEETGFKQFRNLGDRSVLGHALDRIERAAMIDGYRLVGPPGQLERTRSIGSVENRGKCRGVLEGGNSRRESVRRGLEAYAGESPDRIFVHDAARPLVPAELFTDMLEVLEETGAAGVVPVLPVADTIKRVDETGTVTETLDRGDLRRVQTPQLFEFTSLEEAHREEPEDRTVTDDASLLEARDRTVVTTAGSPFLRKITYRSDLEVLERMLGREEDVDR